MFPTFRLVSDMFIYVYVQELNLIYLPCSQSCLVEIVIFCEAENIAVENIESRDFFHLVEILL